MGAAEGRRLGLVRLPFDVPPLDFGHGPTIRARDFEGALVRLGVGPQHVRRVQQSRGAAQDDLAIGEAEGPPFGQGDRAAFGGRFHGVRFVDQQNSDVVAGKRRDRSVDRPDSSASPEMSPRKAGVASKIGSRSETT